MDEHKKANFNRKKAISGFLWSFINAANGIRFMFKSQLNFYVHLLAMIVALSAAFYFPLENFERAIIVIMIALVISAEILNSSIEELCNIVDKSYNPKIGKVKDMAAGAVLVLAIASIVVAALIFWPFL